MRSFLLLLVAAPLVAAPLAAQHDTSHHPTSPYADDTDRPIKTLSAEETTGLLEGRGLGFARAAELNGYPGPLHVLELSDELELSPEQRTETRRLYDAMLTEARSLGTQLVDMEQRLDALYASGEATPEAVDRITTHLGQTRGQLRAVHLRAHIAMRDALTPEQIAAYTRLRGYTVPPVPDSAAVVAVAERFTAAIAAADRATVEALLLPEALILEGGGVETREEYFGHHFGSDAAFLAAMEGHPLSRTVQVVGEVAWVASTTRLQATYRERSLDLDSAELLVLYRVGGAWRIAAVHWSSRSRD